MAGITESKSWMDAKTQAHRLHRQTMRQLFNGDPGRFDRFSVNAAGLFLDYSKNKIDDGALGSLLEIAKARKIEDARDAMVSGAPINVTEQRAVLHVALRDFAMRAYHINGENVASLIQTERERIKSFVDRIHGGDALGGTGKPIKTVINIGIGGSDLGPKMVVAALRPYWLEGRRTYFVSNVDGQQLTDTLEDIDPETTLFIIASKTFTTQETMTNAMSARQWFLENGGTKATIANHFVALSTNESAVKAFGIDGSNMFRFWDWVGGRYSLWSAIGLSIALQIGYQNFEKLLRGAHNMDEHFRSAPLSENMPVLLALIGVWNRNFMDIPCHAVLPYDEHLSFLPAYLQQADMESNGKSRQVDGHPVSWATGPVLFGEPGTNGQHAFYQLLHQGTDIVSADFIAPARSHAPLGNHHEKLLANFLAQTEALMIGRTITEVRDDLAKDGVALSEIEKISPHKVFDGDRPTNSILFECLTPEILGALIALYEHKIFCQGVIWNINSFDQWGVELGKVLAKNLLPEIAPIGDDTPMVGSHDSSTNGLINKINAMRNKADN